MAGELMTEAPMQSPHCSQSIAALAAALAKAQGEMQGASKDSVNPHFKSRYADLASVWDACRAVLSKNGLAVLQPVRADGPSVTVTTILTHSSGEWISEALTMTATQNTPQGVGSAITYGRRYGLAAMVGIAPEDDDGNAASQQNGRTEARPAALEPAAPLAPKGYSDWWADMVKVANGGTQALQTAWAESKKELRSFATTHRSREWDALKEHAATVKEQEPVSA